MKWFRRAADQGDASAQLNLSELYTDGKGVPQDYAEEAKWARKAADQGYARAQYTLGEMHYRGEGVPQCYVQAQMWLNLAVAHGYADAAKLRDATAAAMTPAQTAEAQRLAREWKPTTAAGSPAAKLTADDNREEARCKRQADRKPQRGEDVRATVTLPVEVAKYGGSARVLLPTGRAIEVKVPAGVKDGAQLRLRGLGAPGLDGGEPGDALVSIV